MTNTFFAKNKSWWFSQFEIEYKLEFRYSKVNLDNFLKVLQPSAKINLIAEANLCTTPRLS